MSYVDIVLRQYVKDFVRRVLDLSCLGEVWGWWVWVGGWLAV